MVVLQFFENSLLVFFKGFQVVSYLSLNFYNSELAVAAFVPQLLFFREVHSDVLTDFHNSDLLKLLVCTAAINFPEPLYL